MESGMARQEKPIKTTTEWTDPNAAEVKGEVIGKAGRHHGAEYIQRSKEANAEYRAKILRDMGGRKRDRRRIRPQEYAESGRTWKSSSKIRATSPRAILAGCANALGTMRSRQPAS